MQSWSVHHHTPVLLPMPSARSRTLDLNRTIFQDLADWAKETPELLDHLYESAHAVQSIFRAIPPIARLYVTRLLHIPSHESAPSIDSFRKCLRRRQRAVDRHDAAVRALKALRILVPEPGGDGRLRLHARFAAQLRRSVAYAVDPVFGGPSEDVVMVDNESPAAVVAELDQFAAAKLERVLNYIVESNGSNTPGGKIVHALIRSGLLETGHQGMCITSMGFQFLLKDSFAQLWVLLRSIVLTQFHKYQLDALDLIFKLSFACPGREYRDQSLSQAQNELLAELHEVGIVKLDKSDYSFWPTMIGVRLLSQANRVSSGPTAISEPSSMKKTAGEIQIFVETNFRVYAYTTSTFQTNLLALFTHMRYRLPGMVVGHLTRDAVRQALQSGITGDQIIGYLNAHGHPRMKNGVIPTNVSDEIRLWEAEQDRVKTVPGVLFGDFSSHVDFEQVLSYANDMGAVLWSNPVRRQLVVAKDSYESVKSFVRTNGI